MIVKINSKFSAEKAKKMFDNTKKEFDAVKESYVRNPRSDMLEADAKRLERGIANILLLSRQTGIESLVKQTEIKEMEIKIVRYLSEFGNTGVQIIAGMTNLDYEAIESKYNGVVR